MIKSKKQSLIVVGAFILVLCLLTTTYAFFNYTRTGSSNTIKVGRITFSSNQNNTINLTNMFPMTSTEAERGNIDSLTITIDGDTTYSDGEEFLVSITDVNNNVNNKIIPVSYIATYVAQENKSIGESSDDYYNERESGDVYLLNDEGIIDNNAKVLVEHIGSGDSGIHGILTIKAYIDADRIAITDTYPPTEIQYEFNNHLSNTELASCISFVNDEWYYSDYLDSGTTAESFCQGTGTSYNATFQEWIEEDWFYDSELEYLKTHRIMIPIDVETNDTTNDWVNGRIVFTTDEWNSLTSNSISFKIKVESNEGVWVQEEINLMSNINYPRNSDIKEIHFIRETPIRLQQRYNAAEGIKTNMTANNEGMVLGWQENDILYIGSTGTTYLLTGSGLFSGFTSVEKVVFENVNSSRVTTMAGMFNGCNNLKEVNIEVLDASNVTSMNRMFYNCYHLESVNLGPMNAKNVEDVDYLFAGCNLLEEANISNIGNDNLSTMSLFLSGCISLKKLIANGFNFGTSYMSYTFTRATNLEILDLSNAKNIDFYYAFDGMTKLREINFAGASLRSSANSMQAAFRGCTSLTSLDLSSLDLSYLTVTVNAFSNCSSLTTIYVSNNSFDLDINTYSDYMFYGCTSLVGGSGTTFDSSHGNVEYAIIDGGQNNPGYLTLKTN